MAQFKRVEPRKYIMLFVYTLEEFNETLTVTVDVWISNNYIGELIFLFDKKETIKLVKNEPKSPSNTHALEQISNLIKESVIGKSYLEARKILNTYEILYYEGDTKI